MLDYLQDTRLAFSLRIQQQEGSPNHPPEAPTTSCTQRTLIERLKNVSTKHVRLTNCCALRLLAISRARFAENAARSQGLMSKLASCCSCYLASMLLCRPRPNCKTNMGMVKLTTKTWPYHHDLQRTSSIINLDSHVCR